MSTCSGIFDLPSPNRMDPSAAASGTPIAVSTGDGPRSPELQADPEESAKRRMATIKESASTRSKLTFRLPGNLNARGPFTEVPASSAVMRSHSSLRSTVRRSASACISLAADRSEIVDRLDRADLPIRRFDRNQPRVGPQRVAQAVRINEAFAIRREQGELHAALLEPTGGHQHRLVLHGRGDEVIAGDQKI